VSVSAARRCAPHREHTTLCYAGDDATTADVEMFERTAHAAVSAVHGRMDIYLIAAANAAVDTTLLPLIRDTAGQFARVYSPTGACTYVVRPDGYLGFIGPCVDGLLDHLRATFG
jgi:hypothetical protein